MEHGDACDAAYVAQHLDRPEIGFEFLQAVGTRLIGRHVPLVDRDAGLTLELLRGLVVVAAIRRDVVAGRLQRLGDRFTDPTCSTRHHRNARHSHPPNSNPGPPRPPKRRMRGLRTRASYSGFGCQRSTHMAMPIPPPMQSVARPFLALRFCISNSSVTSTRPPEAPIG